jgi:hypothetical protein
MASVSSSMAQNGVCVQAVHAGVNFAFVGYNSSGLKTPFSMSVSDAIVMLNMPRNARVIAAYLGGITDDGNLGLSLGDPGSATRYGTQSVSATAIGVNWFDTGAAGFTYSISDDQTTWPLTLTVQDATSVTGSLSVHVGVLWVKV